ncbi:MAG: nucleoside recognition domain-containing protein [Verrucomicrobiota bacterium]
MQNEILEAAKKLRWETPDHFHDQFTQAVYRETERLVKKNVRLGEGQQKRRWEKKLDFILTNKWTAFPMMFLILGVVLWLTIQGANVPCSLLARLLVDQGHHALQAWTQSLPVWEWLRGLLIDGVYLTTAWVISVMLFPMAIFFPLFTILEDFGYLPRVAFNMDPLFKKVGAHGKQALTMAMGMGCNAAGVIAARIIDSPRERLIAILTNNFCLCNGRWPTQIVLATIFIGAMVPRGMENMMTTACVVGIVFLGLALTFGSSWLLAKTLLRGEPSTFSLELPPFRPPRILKTLYTSIIDRTIFVLWRAILFAMPAGAIIWLVSNISIGERTLAAWGIHFLNPLGWIMGLNGIILLAYIVAIPANEIIIPTILMLTVLTNKMSGIGEQGAGVLFETKHSALQQLLTASGWTTLTAICLMIFCLSHNPCSTTIYTIWKETRSVKWTAVSILMPLIIGFILCAMTAALWRGIQ